MILVRRLLFWGFLFGCHSIALAQAAVDLDAVRVELLELRRLDQAAIMSGRDRPDELAKTLYLNLARIKELVRIYGWPTIDMVGEEASQGAWLAVQHADFDVDYQRSVLKLLRPLALVGSIHPEQYALLFDRVAVNSGLKQRYGSQGQCRGPGKWELRPVEDMEGLDARRSELALPPLRDYVERVTRFCK